VAADLNRGGGYGSSAKKRKQENNEGVKTVGIFHTKEQFVQKALQRWCHDAKQVVSRCQAACKRDL
jgi:hypothetical protein